MHSNIHICLFEFVVNASIFHYLKFYLRVVIIFVMRLYYYVFNYNGTSLICIQLFHRLFDKNMYIQTKFWLRWCDINIRVQAGNIVKHQTKKSDWFFTSIFITFSYSIWSTSITELIYLPSQK